MSKPIKVKLPGAGGRGGGGGVAGNDRKLKSADVVVHESTAILPPLNSAPPSGNFPIMTATATDHPLSTFPPPPPPPPRVGSLQQVPVMPPLSVSMPPLPSTTVLPPPPNISPMPTSTTNNVLFAAASGGPSMPLPPPPPPPPRATGPTIPPPSNVAPNLLYSSVHTDPATNDGTTQTLNQSSSPPPLLPLTTFLSSSSGRQKTILAQRQSHVPILVIATEAANQIAWKNSLQLVDLFQGIIQDVKLQQNNNLTPFRSIYKSLFLTEVKVRFVEPSQLDPLSYEAAHDLLNENAKIQPSDGNVAQDLVVLEDRVDELLQERNKEETLQAATKDAFQLTSPLDIPWLVRYRVALDASTNALPHDLINAPPLVLLVCTTTEIEPPDQVLQQLYISPHVLPDAYKNGLYDPQSMRHEVLVLHDAVHGPSNVDDNLLRQSLQRQFGPNAAVLRINSVLPDTAAALVDQEEQDLWGGNGQLGNYLSVNDRILLRRYFQSILTTSLLPAMERRISELNAIVNERKKGVRNLVKSFWRKPKDENEPSSASGFFGEGGKVKARIQSSIDMTRLNRKLACWLIHYSSFKITMQRCQLTDSFGMITN
jgi:hypothetical protein